MNSKPKRPNAAAPLAVALSLGALVLAGSGVALAAPLAAPHSNDEVVQFSDVNTATPAGVQELANRIENAAWQVCMDAVPPGATGPGNIANAQCQQTVVKETVDKLNNPALSSMFPAVPAGEDLLTD